MSFCLYSIKTNKLIHYDVVIISVTNHIENKINKHILRKINYAYVYIYI